MEWTNFFDGEISGLYNVESVAWLLLITLRQV